MGRPSPILRFPQQSRLGVEERHAVVKFLESEPPVTSRLIRHYQELLRRERTAERVAIFIGRPVKHVRRVLRLSKLPRIMLKALDEREVSVSVAERVARVAKRWRNTVSAYVLAGETTFTPGEVLPRAGRRKSLNDRQTDELIRSHFQRELKSAPWDFRIHLPMFGDRQCKYCPDRAGNDTSARKDNVRADVCLIVECFDEKCRIYANS